MFEIKILGSNIVAIENGPNWRRKLCKINGFIGGLSRGRDDLQR